ncbi:hypothetical protein HM1_2533 [Heliomicrobium modesticaldum Ice1]|uniref:Uncharacterized protein n=1 Tax=Heliobacterium modesticaldum (strain ATCC 51547 / Ice1) TaxID=498761 RepID=B0TAV9_HELMI|nr:hypothetical protein HM1_2533 [Heliomicrobium modesticaldum Ice1]
MLNDFRCFQDSLLALQFAPVTLSELFEQESECISQGIAVVIEITGGFNQK